MECLPKTNKEFFMFWYKYEHEDKNPNLIKYYKQIKEKGIQFPSEVTLQFIPRKVNKNNQTQLTEKIHINVALEDILSIIQEAQRNLQNSPEKLIDKQYVRLLKIKNKYLYQLSIGNTSTLSTQQKQNISNYYKRIRKVLKKIDEINQDIVKKNKLNKEKIAKMQQSKLQQIPQNQYTDLLDLYPTSYKNNNQSFHKNTQKQKLQTIENNKIDLLQFDLKTPKYQQQQEQSTKIQSYQYEDLLGNNNVDDTDQFTQYLTSPSADKQQQQNILQETVLYASVQKKSTLNILQNYGNNQQKQQLPTSSRNYNDEKFEERQTLKQNLESLSLQNNLI